MHVIQKAQRTKTTVAPHVLLEGRIAYFAVSGLGLTRDTKWNFEVDDVRSVIVMMCGKERLVLRVQLDHKLRAEPKITVSRRNPVSVLEDGSLCVAFGVTGATRCCLQLVKRLNSKDILAQGVFDVHACKKRRRNATPDTLDATDSEEAPEEAPDVSGAEQASEMPAPGVPEMQLEIEPRLEQLPEPQRSEVESRPEQLPEPQQSEVEPRLEQAVETETQPPETEQALEMETQLPKTEQTLEMETEPPEKEQALETPETKIQPPKTEQAPEALEAPEAQAVMPLRRKRRASALKSSRGSKRRLCTGDKESEMIVQFFEDQKDFFESVLGLGLNAWRDAAVV